MSVPKNTSLGQEKRHFAKKSVSSQKNVTSPKKKRHFAKKSVTSQKSVTSSKKASLWQKTFFWRLDGFLAK